MMQERRLHEPGDRPLTAEEIEQVSGGAYPDWDPNNAYPHQDPDG